MTFKYTKHILSTALVLCAISAPAIADDFSDKHWLDKERFQIRARALAILADGDGTVQGTTLETDVSDAYVPEVDFTYFFTRNIATELVVATAQHDVSAGNFDLGQTFILPPTLLLQYHFQPEKKFSPYIGAGVNYSLFYGDDDDAGFNDLDVSGGLGFALQIGADYWLNDNWGLNIDAKYIDLNIDASVNSGGTTLRANDVELNPVIIGAGVSYRF